MGWTPEKPRVYKDEGVWYVELEHQTWIENTWFDTWEHAVEHALWMGLVVGAWEMES